MFINLANDPVVERLIIPKVALTVAEYLAFEKGMHIPVSYTHLDVYKRQIMCCGFWSLFWQWYC